MEDIQVTQDVKEKIKEAAGKLFTQNGFNGTSIRDIAAASDTNIAMVNYYFRSKHNLFTDIFSDAFTIIMGKVFEIVDSDLPFLEMVRKWIYTYYDILKQYPGLPLFVMNEISQRPEVLNENLDFAKAAKIFDALNRKFEEEKAKGAVMSMSIQDLGMNVVSLCIFPFAFGPIALSVLKLSKEDYDEFLDKHKLCVADFVINGLKVR